MVGYESRESIQGGSKKNFQIDPTVSSARITITSTSGLPIQALIELLQGPNRVAQLAEIYDQNGETFSTVVETPGYGSTIEITNQGPMEYPFSASVEPMSYDDQMNKYGGNNRDFGDYNQGTSSGGQMSSYENNRNYGGYNQGMSNGQQMSGYNSNSRDFG
eukprot:15336585-Ditylum_brightwellii.AAC.1